MSEMEQKEEQLMLKQVTGTPRHIEINERTLEATRKAFRDKGLEITKYRIPTRTILSYKKAKEV